MEHISKDLENKGTQIKPMDYADQKRQEANEGQAHVEDKSLMSNKSNHSVDLTIVQKISIKEQIDEVPHIHFLYRGQ